jgi:crotonobetainyl-CoA:carnitine CoA-transferase CaiB-like acyl-CoA transferase
MTPREAVRPLEGISVIDFGAAVAGPSAGSLLAELGADVVKVMHRNDLVFDIKPTIGRTSTTFFAVNWNKRRVDLDLRVEEDHRQAVELVRGCDVLLQNSRRGVMDKLRLSFADVAAMNPAVVYCSISGLAEGHEMADLPMTDPHMQAYSGLTDLLGGERLRYYAVLDILAGCAAVEGILVALNRRRTEGLRAQRVDVTMAEAARYLIELSLIEGARRDASARTVLVQQASYLTVDGTGDPVRHDGPGDPDGYIVEPERLGASAAAEAKGHPVMARLLDDHDVMSDPAPRRHGLLRDVQVAEGVVLTLAGPPWEFTAVPVE